jgi:hypothetical protein
MIETTQPHISSKALLENLAARDQETEIRGIQQAATPNTFELEGARIGSRETKYPNLASLTGSQRSILPAREKPELFFAKTIMPVEN